MYRFLSTYPRPPAASSTLYGGGTACSLDLLEPPPPRARPDHLYPDVPHPPTHTHKRKTHTRRLTKKLFTCRRPDSPGPDGVGPEQATQGRMRIGLPGSNSFGGGLSSLSQSGAPRSRSGTGSWSGGDRAASAAAGWPRGFARGGGGGGVGVSGCHTPPMATTSTSWTKLSAATLAAQRFTSSCANQEGYNSPSAGSQQPSAAEVFSCAASALADDTPGSGAPKPPQEGEEDKEAYSPFALRSAYRGVDGGCHESAVGGPPVAERRWQDGEVPFREKGGGDAERERGGAGSAAPEGSGKRVLHEVITGTRETTGGTRGAAPRGGPPAGVAFSGGVQSAPAAAAQPPFEAAMERVRLEAMGGGLFFAVDSGPWSLQLKL